MASDSPSGLRDAAAGARQLALALDALESRLAQLEFGADADTIAEALAGPVRALDAAAKAALSREAPS
ncbi:MAG: hypothetical protein R3C16_10525 [Hyphomonadaceae bacterium]